MEEKKNENEKAKKSFSKRGLVIGLSALLLAGGGATGFMLANKNDAKAMESGMEQVAVQTPIVNATPTSTLDLAAPNEQTKQEAPVKNLWLDKHKITINSENPTNVAIKATDAAKIALDNIAADKKQVDDDCDVELFHMNTAGTGKSTGVWIGVAVLNDTNRYEFRINDSTGEVIQRDDYVSGEGNILWKRTNGNGKAVNEAVINDQKLAAFSKIDATKINVADCEIVEGKNYGIYIKYNDLQQKASYESKNGVLTVKVERIKNVRQYNVNAKITITVPKNTKFDSIVYTSGVGDFSMGEFAVKTLKLTEDCGSIKLKGTCYENAELSADCGNASLSKCKMQNTKLSADCGNASFTDCTMNKTIVSADCGNISIKNSIMTDTKMKSNCGTIKGSNLVSKDLSLRADYGNIEVAGDLAGKNDLTASMGCIGIGCTKDKSQYNYDLKVSDGSVFIDKKAVKKADAKSQNSSAKNSITAMADTGSCSVVFKADPKAKIEVPDEDYDSWDENKNCFDNEWNDMYNSWHEDNDWDDDDWDDDWDEDDDDWDDDRDDFNDSFFRDFL